MLLALRFFSLNDIFLFPLCVLIFYAIIRNKAERPSNSGLKKIYYRGFYFKVFFVLAFTFVSEYIFKGGDTGLYYQGIMDLRAALHDDFDHIFTIIKSKSLTIENPLAPYFYYDHYADDFTYNYMRDVSNFSVPRLGLLPAIIFFDSYLCISMVFGFFALGGAIRIFKFFYYYFPRYKTEIAVASIFIPSVCFWSSGLLKDSICFGAIGYILYGLLNILVIKKNITGSIVVILISGILLFYIKVYILLAFVLALTIWLFAETNKKITDSTLRTMFSVLTFTVSVGVAYLLLNYFTSQEAAQTFKLETLLEKSEKQREALEAVKVEGGSSFQLNASNPVTLVFGSLSATFFRPFPWEINTPVALFSCIESMIFFFLTLNFFFKRGIKEYFKIIFRDPKLLMCFVFAIVFGISVGASTTNFGALSRYKIPCMPFYFVMLLLTYRISNLGYPKWFSPIIKWFK